MRTLSRGNSALKRLSYDAVMIAAALVLSYIEHLLPLSFLIPLPGVKLGLSNIVVILAFFALSKLDAAVISFVRITLTSLIFGSFVSFLFSLFGGALAYLAVFALGGLLKREKISFLGVSCVSAVLHSVGQISAAVIIYTPAAVSYLPILMLASTVMGTVTGVLLNLIYKRLERALNV